MEQYSTGMTSRHYRDPERKSWTDDGPRPIVANIWYPAAPDAPTRPLMIGPKNAPYFHAGSFAMEAPLLEDDPPRPLVLLSHGSGGSVVQLAWLADALVTAGFLVAGVNHHGNTAIQPYVPEGFLYWWHRGLDLSRVIDAVLEDPVFSSQVDAHAVTTAGFSYGGFTGLLLAGGTPTPQQLAEFCESEHADASCGTPPGLPDPGAIGAIRERMRSLPALGDIDPPYSSMDLMDSRIRAACALSPPLGGAFAPADFRRIEVPTLFVVPERDPLAPKEQNAAYMAGHIPGAELEVLPGSVGHYAFMSEATEAGRESHPQLCRDAPGVDRGELHREVGPRVAAFLRQAVGAVEVS